MLAQAKWYFLPALLVLCGWAQPTVAEEVSKPVRVADSSADKFERKFPGTSHAHPGICVGRTGTVVVVHYVERAGLVLISRSTDGGRTWSASQPVPDVNCKCYPGAISTLGDGRMVVTWNGWLEPADKDKGRRPHFAVSSDEGKTWSKPQAVPIEEPTSNSRVRHSILELGPDRWLFPLTDRTVVLDPQTGRLGTLGDGGRRSYGEPLVRTAKGTLLSGNGWRSTDGGKTWQQVRNVPSCANYHNDMIALANGWVVATEAGKGKTSMRLIVSRDDGLTWDFDKAFVFYDPGRTYGNGSPHLALIDSKTLGAVFLDGDGVFFLSVPLANLER
jgi:hypothetical protein